MIRPERDGREHLAFVIHFAAMNERTTALGRDSSRDFTTTLRRAGRRIIASSVRQARRLDASFSLLVCVSCVLLISGCAPKQQNRGGSEQGKGSAPLSADLVITNARVWTAAPPDRTDQKTIELLRDPQRPVCLAVKDDKITAIARDASAFEISADTRVIDAGGRRLIPGLVDSHTHMIAGGMLLDRLRLRNVPDREAFIQSIRRVAKAKQAGEWILGGNWSAESWPDPAPPRKAWIDPDTRGKPVFLRRMDGHQALANRAALRLAGIDRDGPADPKGGEIERDPGTGEPTGILKESAMDLVSRLIPEPSLQQKRAALKRAMRHANALGITSVHDMAQPGDMPAFLQAARNGKMTVRATLYIHTDDWVANLARVQAWRDATAKGRYLRVVGCKGFMDGSLGSRTAYMREPFADATPETLHPQGQLTAFADPPAKFCEAAIAASQGGMQLAVHAIGDEANHLVLNTYEEVNQRGQKNGRPPDRIEHAQHLLPADIARFRQLGVVASMQPFHKADDGRYAETALGKERLRGAYAYRELIESGAIVCFGSDWPVVTMSPLAGMEAAVTARTVAGDGSLHGPVWLPSHSISIEQALVAYTLAPHEAVGRAGAGGRILPGQDADFVILDEDVLTADPAGLSEIRPLYTVVGGQVVFDRES